MFVNHGFNAALTLEPDNPQIIGNLARAQIRSNTQGPDTRQLLTSLVALDRRPDWVGWAREQLAVGHFPASTDEKADADHDDTEELPLPKLGEALPSE